MTKEEILDMLNEVAQEANKCFEEYRKYDDYSDFNICNAAISMRATISCILKVCKYEDNKIENKEV